MKALKEKLTALPPSRRRRIARRTKVLVVEEMTLRGQLEAQIPAAASPRDRSNPKSPWKNEITRTFMEAADDLKGVTEQEIP